MIYYDCEFVGFEGTTYTLETTDQGAYTGIFDPSTGAAVTPPSTSWRRLGDSILTPSWGVGTGGWRIGATIGGGSSGGSGGWNQYPA